MKYKRDIDNYLNNIYTDIKFDDQQKSVITNNDSHLMVIAGAGAGKSTTISAKVKYLVDYGYAKENEILVISLTNKATNELIDSINNHFNLKIKICTFHKLAYDLLKEHDSRVRILSDQQEIISEIIRKDKKTSKIIKILNRDKAYKEKDKNSLSSLEYLTQFTMDNIKLLKVNPMVEEEGKKYSVIVKEYMGYLIGIYEKYSEYIYSNNLYDFEDLILEASKLKTFESKYKYIFIDEYQDISTNRFELFKNMVEVMGSNSIVVGDDFQSIYAFSGAKIDLFLKYKELMNAKVLKITKTYRNSQELINIAGKIVMKNGNQIKKELVSNKRNDFPIVIRGYDYNFNSVFTSIIKEIIQKHPSGQILVLGRYKNDINKLTSREFVVHNEKIIYKLSPKTNINYMTIHASKGLGYDNVILINLEKGKYGFPSSIEETLVKKELFNLGIDKNFEEERRLLYVALTRTKNTVYCVVNKNNESIFLNEILNYDKVSIDYKYKCHWAKKNHKKFYDSNKQNSIFRKCCRSRCH